MRSFLPILLIIFGNSVVQSQCPDIRTLTDMPLEAYTAETFKACDSYALLHILGAAEALLADSTPSRQLLGDIWLNILSEELQSRKGEEDFDPDAPEMARIVQNMANHQYHIALSRPSDTEKLFQYLKQGRLQYVIKRMFDRHLPQYFLLGEFILLMLLLFFLHKRRQRRTIPDPA